MTKLIPRDAAIAVAKSLFRLQTTGLYGAVGVPQYGMLTETAETAIRAISTIDPAAIREATMKEATDSFRGMADFCKTMGDLAGARALHSAAAALIGEKK